MLKFLSLLLVAATALPAAAQTLYNVRVGTFQDVTAGDFNEIRELGFVYGSAREEKLTDVYLGNFSDRQRAETAAAALVARGFRNAIPLAIPSKDARSATFVQVALRGRTPLDWTALQRAGDLFVESLDGTVKVLAGPYTNDSLAQRALTNIRLLGYNDAFTKSLDLSRLVPVGYFESGLKKALIPIDLSRKAPPLATPPPPPTRTAPAPPPTNAAAAPTPTAPAEEALGEAAVAASSPPPPPAPSTPTVDSELPTIDVKTKRHSAAELQRVLKEKGYYAGSIDGYYGEGTRGAYERAWAGMDELRNYRTLADAAALPATRLPLRWPELRVLLVVADDLAAGLGNVATDSRMQARREGLLYSEDAPPAAIAKTARAWEKSVWANLNAWATEDPLHARLLSVLRVAYYQSQARLEAMYLQDGLSAEAARDQATAVLENLLSGPLDRFG